MSPRRIPEKPAPVNDVTLPNEPMVGTDGQPIDPASLFDGGKPPGGNQFRYRPLRDVYGDDFAAAQEKACEFSDDLADLYRAEALIVRPFNRRAERLDGVIARAEERVARLKGRREALIANREAALKPNRESREWRLQRLDEFRRDYNAWLRLKASARLLYLPGGKFTFHHHSAKTKLLEPMAADGMPITGKTDEAAFIEVLAVLKRCGLHEAYEPLVVTTAKVVLTEVKQRLSLTKDGPVLKVEVRGDPEGLYDRVTANGGTAFPTANRTTGEIIGWTVTFPAVQVIRDPNTGDTVMERPLLRKVAPEEEWTLGFVPNEPGVVHEDTEEEDHAEAEA